MGWLRIGLKIGLRIGLKVELEQPIHGNILGHSATVGVFVAIEFSLCDVFLKLLYSHQVSYMAARGAW